MRNTNTKKTSCDVRARCSIWPHLLSSTLRVVCVVCVCVCAAVGGQGVRRTYINAYACANTKKNHFGNYLIGLLCGYDTVVCVCALCSRILARNDDDDGMVFFFILSQCRFIKL